MKHFIVGPVEMYPCTKEVYKDGIVYFRTNDFSNIVFDCLEKLSNLIGNKTKNSIVYLTASGTAAMEAVVENCVFDDDRVLVVNGGTFGKRFCELLNYHNKNFSSIDLSWGETLSLEHFSKFENQNYTMLFVNLHETSTGQLYDIKIISDFCKRNNILLVVDAISTFLADEYDMDKHNIDCTIISSQKGLCLSAGLSMISMSDRMLKKLENCTKTASSYFNLTDYFKNIERGQTPYTPAVGIIYELKNMLEFIDKSGGRELWLKNIQNKANYFRQKAKEFGFKIPNYPLSNMLTPLVFEDISATQIVQALKDEYQIYVNPCGGGLADKVIRISHIGNTTIGDIDDLLEKMLLVINKIKAKELVYDR